MTEAAPALFLASASPRRAEILDSLGLAYTVVGMDIDETRLPGEAAGEMVMRLAAGKAAAARNTCQGAILAADTAVVIESEIFSKPRDQEDALAMLQSLSGRTHRVMTGVAVYYGSQEQVILSCSEVRFREIGPDEALAYWQSGEPRDKAGAYAIQGLGGSFVAEIRGSYTGIVGLPVFETTSLLAAVGINVLSRARSA